MVKGNPKTIEPKKLCRISLSYDPFDNSHTTGISMSGNIDETTNTGRSRFFLDARYTMKAIG